MKPHFKGIAALVGAVAAIGQGQPAKATTKYSADYGRCVASSDAQLYWSAMGGCIDAEARRQDIRLNAAYQAALKRMEFRRQQQALRKAQRAWIAFRDADCESYADADWGKSSLVESAACILRRTAERADELEAYRLDN